MNDHAWIEFGLEVFQPVLDEIHGSFKRYNLPPEEKDDKKGLNGKKGKEVGENKQGEVLRRPGWRLDPTKNIDPFDIDMIQNATMVLMRYGMSAFARVAPNRSLFDTVSDMKPCAPFITDLAHPLEQDASSDYPPDTRRITKLRHLQDEEVCEAIHVDNEAVAEGHVPQGAED